MAENNSFEKSLYTFFLCDKGHLTLTKHVQFSEFVISLSPKTDCLIAEGKDRLTAVLGFCVDSHGLIKKEDIVQQILESSTDKKSLLSFCDRLAGKYVIISALPDGEIIILTDATASMPVYCYTKGVCISSLEYLIAMEYSLSESEKTRQIIKKSRPNMPLPNDMAMFDDVKCLLPNHYLDVKAHAAIRFYPDVKSAGMPIDANEAAKKTYELVANIVRQYSKQGKLLCPLTGGYDSRLIFSFLHSENPDIQCYTSMHKSFTDRSDDVCIPKEITKKYNARYRLIEDLEAPDEENNLMKEWLPQEIKKSGPAYTQNTLFPDTITVCGDIIDQLGKSAIGGSLSESFSTASYFQCKLHHFSKLSKDETKKWLAPIKERNSKISSFDLFGWENRCGRWTAKTQNAFSLLGRNALNIFNCREIIDLWTRVPSKDRIRKKLHKELFMLTNSDLLDIPFNPQSLELKGKHSPILMLFGTYLKHFYHKLTFKGQMRD